MVGRKQIASGTYHISKIMNAPLTFVYKWCTDFREDDGKITGSKSIRKILIKNKRRIVYADEYGSSGTTKGDVSIVSLFPPNAWHLDNIGDDLDETGDYDLSREGKNKTRLEMTFRVKYKEGVRDVPTKAEWEKDTDDFWDKLVAALEMDYKNTLAT